MIVIDCEQGTEEWLVARSGSISASRFKEARSKIGGLDERQKKYVDFVLGGMPEKDAAKEAGFKTPPKAESVKKALNGERAWSWSDTAKNYAFELAVERLNGEPFKDAKFSSYAMQRGNALEPVARSRHALEIGQPIEEVGTVKSDCERFSASPDGLIGEDGGSEYKCLVAPASLRSVLFEDDISDFMDQIQGGMWLTNRQWWDFVLYAPQLEIVGLDFCRMRVERDEQYIAELVSDLEEFDELVESMKKRLQELGEEGWSDSNA